MILNNVDNIMLGSIPVDKVYRGSTLVWERSLLPSGYTECEYLESTGTQWIDTNCTPLPGDEIECEYMHTSWNEQSVIFDAGTGTYRVIVIISGLTYFRCFTSGSGSSSNYGVSFQPTAIKILSDGSVIHNGNIILGEASKPKGQVDTPITILARTNHTGCAYARIYKFVIKNITNLIPALDPSGRPCMYDTVTKKPFYNQGTGEFLYKIKEK